MPLRQLSPALDQLGVSIGTLFRQADTIDERQARRPEIVVDICQAIETRFAIDMTSRYNLATRPCIVEFGMPADHLERAIAAALWYLEAASRGERTTNAH